MPLPDIDDAAIFGGANLVDYGGQAVVDPTTDRSAQAVNSLVNDVACMTHMAFRAWMRFAPAGTGAPSVVASDALWAGAKDVNGNILNASPTVARTGVGLYTVTFPAQVYDEIQPAGSPGYVGLHTINIRSGFVPAVIASGGNLYLTQTTPTANALGLQIYLVGSGLTLADPTGLNFDLFIF